MKRPLKFLLTGLLILSVFACSKDDSSEVSTVGYPGMGSRVDEELSIAEQFTLPEGVSIKGDIVGVARQYASNLKSTDSDLPDLCNALGGTYVSVMMTLINDNLTETGVDINAGTLFKIIEENLPEGYDASDFQVGIVLENIYVKINAGDEVTVGLNLFCLNKGLNGSIITPGISLVYNVAGITDAEGLLTLATLINEEPYDYNGTEDNLMTLIYDDEAFSTTQLISIIEKIQEIVWYLTEHDSDEAMSAEQIRVALQGVLNTVSGTES